MGNKKTWNCKNCYTPIYPNKSCLCKECLKMINNQKKIYNWLEYGDSNCKIGSTIRNCIRDYIYQKQDNKCAICQMSNIWNGKKINFILDHIDGNAANNYSENLRLICPNCDSQLPTYKSKNRNSARTARKEFLHNL